MYTKHYNSRANQAVPANPQDRSYYTPLNRDEAIAEIPASNDPDIAAANKAAEQKREQGNNDAAIIMGTLNAGDNGRIASGSAQLANARRTAEEREKEKTRMQVLIDAVSKELEELAKQAQEILSEIYRIQKKIIESERNKTAYKAGLDTDDLDNLSGDERRRVEKCITSHEDKTGATVNRNDKAEINAILLDAMLETSIDLAGQRTALNAEWDKFDNTMAKMDKGIAKGNEVGFDLVKARADMQALRNEARHIQENGIQSLGDDAEMESFERFLGELKQQDLPEHDMADYIGRYTKNMSDTAQDEIKARDDMKQYFEASQPDDSPEPPEPDTPQPPPISLSALPSF